MKTLLIVDDLQEYLDALVRALSTEYEIATAKTLQEAKDKMSPSIALALLDVRLSEQDLTNRDGLLLLAWLREHYPQIPVIMMSAYRDFDSAVDALNLGAARYLKKPINLKELRGLIVSFAAGDPL